MVRTKGQERFEKAHLAVRTTSSSSDDTLHRSTVWPPMNAE